MDSVQVSFHDSATRVGRLLACRSRTCECGALGSHNPRADIAARCGASATSPTAPMARRGRATAHQSWMQEPGCCSLVLGWRAEKRFTRQCMSERGKSHRRMPCLALGMRCTSFVHSPLGSSSMLSVCQNAVRSLTLRHTRRATESVSHEILSLLSFNNMCRHTGEYKVESRESL